MFILIYTWNKFSVNFHIYTDIAAGYRKTGKTAFLARKSKKKIYNSKYYKTVSFGRTEMLFLMIYFLKHGIRVFITFRSHGKV